MPRTASDERPLKRQRSCINYFLSGGIDDSEQDGPPPMGSPMVEHSPAAGFVPSKTPAAALVPAPLPLGGLSPVDAPQVGNTVMHSLQRRFQTQQTLSDTDEDGDALPELPAVGKAGDEEEEFVLYSQPAYERVISQRASLGTAPLSQAPIDEVEEEEEGAAGAVALCECPDEDGGPASQPPAPATTAGAAGHTPAVHSVDRVQLNAGGPSGGVFPIFRSRRDCKIVYIVRHGESEFNAALGKAGSGWADPMIYDAPLTARGRAQARSLRGQVAKWNLPEDTVWVTSPLARAVETMLLAFPGGHACADENAGPAGQCCAARLRNVAVLPDVSEHLMTSGDIGHGPHDLAARFPALAPQMLALPDCWWYTHPGKPNCPYVGQFESTEPKAAMRKRVAAFRKWVQARPEKVFVAVGHSVFWKEFAVNCKGGVKQDSLKNCGWLQLHV